MLIMTPKLFIVKIQKGGRAKDRGEFDPSWKTTFNTL